MARGYRQKPPYIVEYVLFLICLSCVFVSVEKNLTDKIVLFLYRYRVHQCVGITLISISTKSASFQAKYDWNTIGTELSLGVQTLTRRVLRKSSCIFVLDSLHSFRTNQDICIIGNQRASKSMEQNWNTIGTELEQN